MKIKDMCEVERPREKMLSKGPQALSNPELLAILLRTGSGRRSAIDLAHELLCLTGGRLSVKLAPDPLKMLLSIKGIGPDKAATVIAAMELGRRAFEEETMLGSKSLCEPSSVYDIMRPHLKGLDHEELWVIYLNRANFLIAKERITSGGPDSTIIDNRQVVRRCLEHQASGIIIVHNHPSGSPRPGKQDIIRTGSLKKALDTFGISLLDHVIVCDDCYFSFATNDISLP
ncbi:MAG: DNA repair protein RadC [Bacteroidales bacterium]|nr:DNA repair protein RadC [Bacteroidales bacterium]